MDSESAIAHSALAWVFDYAGDKASGLEEAEIAIALNANEPWGYLEKGRNLIFSGRPECAREPLAAALRLDPRGPSAFVVMQYYAYAYYFERDYNAAIAMAVRSIRLLPERPRPHLFLTAALGRLRRREEARAALDAAIAVSPCHFEFITGSRPSYFRAEDHEHLLTGLREAGWEG